jgi:cell division topological specificity factor
VLEWLSRLFGATEQSKDKAKERLRLVLVHDRAVLSPGLLDALREEMIHVLSKYMEIDEKGLEVNLNRSDESVALVANIPVRRVKRKL